MLTLNNARLRLLVALTMLTASGAAVAHPGARIFLGKDGSAVATYLGNNDDQSSVFTAARVFATPLPLFPGTTNVYTTDFPGFEVRAGGNVPSGTSFRFDIAGPLLFFDYDAAGRTGAYKFVQQQFGIPGPAPQVAISEGSRLVVTGPGGVTGFDFFTYGAPGDHGHNFHTLYGNGSSASDGPNGVYALPLEVSAPANGIGASPTFYLLLGKNVSLGSNQMDDAVRVANETLVPEPASLAMGGLATMALLARRRRRA